MKFLSKFKQFFMGMLCMLLIGGITMPVAAGGNSKTIEAFFSGIKIYVDDNLISPKDANGNSIEPFIYNGTTYLPVRAVSQAFGKSVEWDGKTNSVYIGNHNNRDSNSQNNTNQTNSQTEDTSTYFSSLKAAASISSAVSPLKKNQFIKTPRDDKNDTWYKVDLNEGEGLTVALKPQIDKEYMYLELYDAEGSRLSGGSSIYDGEYGLVGYYAEKNSTVYIKVAGESGIYYIGFYDQYYNNANSINDGRDFFGSLNTAKKISQGVFSRDDANLEDWYRVDVKEGQTVTVNITPQIDKDYMCLELYDAEDCRLSGGSSIYNGETDSVSKKASKDCTYFIKISGAEGKYDLRYTINN